MCNRGHPRGMSDENPPNSRHCLGRRSGTHRDNNSNHPPHEQPQNPGLTESRAWRKQGGGCPMHLLPKKEGRCLGNLVGLGKSQRTPRGRSGTGARPQASPATVTRRRQRFALPQKHSRPQPSWDSAATASAATPQARQRFWCGNALPATPTRPRPEQGPSRGEDSEGTGRGIMSVAAATPVCWH